MVDEYEREQQALHDQRGREQEERIRWKHALMRIENHELRDHEDYDAIKEIASEALRHNALTKG